MLCCDFLSHPATILLCARSNQLSRRFWLLAYLLAIVHPNRCGSPASCRRPSHEQPLNQRIRHYSLSGTPCSSDSRRRFALLITWLSSLRPFGHTPR
ncbi:hypothetical protein RvY_06309-6 [Ramazzottius varieornatus]|uniref:Uncharacterized protein n=1 Tax=Ramazzottius varieornatus TaxID=947166 RepID=A0A1D1V1L8_RAMVA|nr:hypothetical protein RvY_06309-6 [Ramazzottius varieornatus]